MKKILFVLPSLEMGGAEKVMSILFNHLNEKEFDGYFFSFKGGLLRKKLKGPKKNQITLNKKKIISGIFHFIYTSRKIKPDIIFSTHSHLNAMICFLKKIKILNSKIVIRESNFLSEQQKNAKTIYEKFFITWFLKKTYPSSNLLICQTNEMLDDANNFFNGKSFLKLVINNPIEIIPKFEEYGNSKNIITIGRLEPQKNQALLIEAFSQICNKIQHNLMIIGHGSQFLNLQDLIKEKKLGGRVFLTGFLDNPWEKYRNSSLFVLPSNFEGFPNVIIESMANSTPVISSDCPSGPKEIIRDKVNGMLFSVGDVEELSRAILRLVNDYKFSESLKRNAYRDIQKYNHKKISMTYQEIFNQI